MVHTISEKNSTQTLVYDVKQYWTIGNEQITYFKLTMINKTQTKLALKVSHVLVGQNGKAQKNTKYKLEYEMKKRKECLIEQQEMLSAGVKKLPDSEKITQILKMLSSKYYVIREWYSIQ